MGEIIGRRYVVGLPVRAELFGLAGKRLPQPEQEVCETLPGIID
jgi:hypothetical protein